MQNLIQNKNIQKIFTIFILTLCALLISYFILSASYATKAAYANTFISDYEAVLRRYDLYTQGQITLWQFITGKQINHNHFFIYLLSFLDIKLFHGSKVLLVAATAIANLVVLAIVGLCLRSVKSLTKIDQAVLLTFTAAQIYTFLGAEIWLYPFQAVLSTFRLFLLLSILLFSLSISSNPHLPKNILLSFMAPVTLLAAVSHGGGIILIPTLLFLSLLLRKKIQILIFGFLFGLIIAYEINTAIPLPLSATQIVLKSVQNFDQLVHSILYVLGCYSGLGELLSCKSIGIVGIFLCLYLIFILGWKWIKHRQINSILLFFVIWAFFSLCGAMLSVMTNIGYAEIRGVPMNDQYFLASRYTVTISGFWISLLSLLVITYRSNQKAQIVHSWYPKFLNGFLLLLSILVWINGMTTFPFWMQVARDFTHGETAIRSSALAYLPPDESNTLVSLPAGFGVIPDLIKTQEKFSLGVFAPDETRNFNQIPTSSNVRVGQVLQFAAIRDGLYRVTGNLTTQDDDFLRLIARPVPLVNQLGIIVGAAKLESVPQFEYSSPQNSMPFIGYATIKRPEPLKAIFPLYPVLPLEPQVRQVDRISRNIARNLKVAAVHAQCFLPNLVNRSHTIQSEKFSDTNWKNGISLGGSGFFTNNLCQLLPLKSGDLLEFKVSGVRKIVQISGNQVWVDGEILDPVGDGYPNAIKIHK